VGGDPAETFEVGTGNEAAFLAGEEDARFTAIAERLVAGLPDARLVLVPGAGHPLELEVDGAKGLARRAHVRPSHVSLLAQAQWWGCGRGGWGAMK